VQSNNSFTPVFSSVVDEKGDSVGISRKVGWRFIYFRTDDSLTISSVGITKVWKRLDLSFNLICLMSKSAAFFPISKPGCMIVLMDGVTTSEKGSLLNPTIKISSGTFIPFDEDKLLR
jgi:hypothetical protein